MKQAGEVRRRKNAHTPEVAGNEVGGVRGKWEWIGKSESES